SNEEIRKGHFRSPDDVIDHALAALEERPGHRLRYFGRTQLYLDVDMTRALPVPAVSFHQAIIVLRRSTTVAEKTSRWELDCRCQQTAAGVDDRRRVLLEKR